MALASIEGPTLNDGGITHAEGEVHSKAPGRAEAPPPRPLPPHPSPLATRQLHRARDSAGAILAALDASNPADLIGSPVFQKHFRAILRWLPVACKSAGSFQFCPFPDPNSLNEWYPTLQDEMEEGPLWARPFPPSPLQFDDFDDLDSDSQARIRREQGCYLDWRRVNNALQHAWTVKHDLNESHIPDLEFEIGRVYRLLEVTCSHHPIPNKEFRKRKRRNKDKGGPGNPKDAPGKDKRAIRKEMLRQAEGLVEEVLVDLHEECPDWLDEPLMLIDRLTQVRQLIEELT